MPGKTRQGRQGGRQYTQQRISDAPALTKSSGNRPHKKTKLAKRALNAFAIAQHLGADNKASNPRNSRLGLLEEDSSSNKNGKRKRDDNDSEVEEEEDDYDEDNERNKKLKRGAKDRFGNEIEGGSDSEGNEWVIGAVASDDDSSLDSDDAMGSSDEERFQGFQFGGSSSKKTRKTKEITLDEDDKRSTMDSGEESEDFAAEAVDLANILEHDDEDEEIDEDSDDTENEDELVMSDVDEDANDPKKLSALQDLLSSMDAENGKKQRSQLDLAQEATTPSEYGLNPKQKLSVADLLATVTDPTLRRSLKILADDDKKGRSKGVPGKLSAPLPKRQQDRVDRIAAFEKSKETLARWIETVKHNRQAEHLMFPLVDQDVEASKSTKRLLPNALPANDLEATVQKILADSGLGETGKKQDQEIQRIEELATNQMPIEEARARQAELRKARDLLFREEIRAKRIKKIKSKAYRRVHRKERERNALREQNALAEAGIVASEDEQEKMDRRRAEERMGQRHRESRWAKAVKETGRAMWDEEARDGVSAMLRQDEELKRRMHGRQAGEDSASDTESGASDEDDEAFAERMHEKLVKLEENASQPGSRLSSMRFMKKAETARRNENEEAMQQLQRELDGASEGEEPNDGDVGTGRRRFGPRNKIIPAVYQKETRQDFEEGQESDQDIRGEENGDVYQISNGSKPSKTSKSSMKAKGISTTTNTTKNTNPGNDQLSVKKNVNVVVEDEDSENPFSTFKKKSKKTRAEPTIEISSVPKPHAKTNSQRNQSSAIKLADPEDAEDSDASFGGFSPTHSKLTETDALIRQAFAGDEDFVQHNFKSEKAALAADEEAETIVSGGLPGWGSWVGPGLTKKEKRNAKASQAASTRISKSSEGVASNQRKDKSLDKVIISEKRVPKTAKYLASNLPHPFESRAQYERSLRLPMGPEFTTKNTFQGMTKPRVLIKGGIVAPMRKPLM